MKTKHSVISVLLIICFYESGFSQSYYDSQKQNRDYQRLQDATKRAYTVPERQSSNSSYKSNSSSSNSSSSNSSNSSSYQSRAVDNSSIQAWVDGQKAQKAYWAEQKKARLLQNIIDEKVYATSEIQSKKLLEEVDSRVMDYSQFIADLNKNIVELTSNTDRKLSVIQTFENKDIRLTASFQDGVMQGVATVKFNNNNKIKSIKMTVVDGFSNGSATILLHNDDTENVNFVNGNLFGKCQLQSADGTKLLSCNRNNNKVSGLVKRTYNNNSFANVLYKENEPVTLLKAYLTENDYSYPSIEMYRDGYLGKKFYDNNLIKKIVNSNGEFSSDNLEDINQNRIYMNGYRDGDLHIDVYGKSRSSTIIYPDGSIYNGVFKQTKKDEGFLSFVNGDVYEGGFEDSEFEGNGKITYADGTIFEGTFKEGQKKGKGKVTKINGKYFTGKFKENESSNVKYFDAQNQEITKEQYDAE